MEDHHKRSLAKAISYRISATLLTSLIAFVVTGKPLLALWIGSIDGVVKIVFYYIHERIWNRMTWGKRLKS